MIPHNRPTINIEEEEAAIRVIRSGWLTQGKEVEAFENEFCKFGMLCTKHLSVGFQKPLFCVSYQRGFHTLSKGCEFVTSKCHTIYTTVTTSLLWPLL